MIKFKTHSLYMAVIWEDGEPVRGPGLRKQYHYPRRETETGRVIKGERSKHLTLVKDRKSR